MAKHRTELEQRTYEERLKQLNESLRQMSRQWRENLPALSEDEEQISLTKLNRKIAAQKEITQPAE